MSNFDLIEKVRKLKIKHFRGVFMRDELPLTPFKTETGIINLDDNTGPGTHWVAYAIKPSSIVYFDSYGLAPPKEFLKYISTTGTPLYYSTLPTQKLTDPPICGQEVLNVLHEISKNPGKPPHTIVHRYTSERILKQ